LERLADLVPASGNEDREILEIKAAPQPVAVIMEEKAEAAIQQEQEVKPAPGIPQPHSTESGVIDHLPGPSSSQGVKPEAEEHQSDKRREHRLPDDHAIEDRVTDDRPAPARRLPLSHLVLLVLTIAVAAMALGYLFAPTIQQFLMRRAQATPSASTPPVAVDLRGHALSPPELRQLAEAGHPDAQWQLGILYHDGDVVPKDDSLAVLWFERAAQQGYVSAQSTLGAYYFAGRGVPQDLSKAFFWSQLALAGGDATSKLRLEDLSARMTKSQVASARQQAEAWLRAHNQPANTKAN
ncbi:MAG: tetratricopeptide repeat protein, partial [Terriglobales bacterium]